MSLKIGVVGLRMGEIHARSCAIIEETDLVAVCDIDKVRAESVAGELNVPGVYTDYDEMLANAGLDAVVIATPNKLHCEMVLKAVNAGMKGIYCEKPVCMNMEELNSMKKACEDNACTFIVGHQRRMSTPYISMKKLIDEGAIGDVYLIRALCAGDCLSDGTHSIDSVLYLLSDPAPESIVSQITCECEDSEDGTGIGKRFGHSVESGSMSVITFKNGVRFELFTGDLRIKDWDKPFPGWNYQDIEILGSNGRIWRCGDNSSPPVKIWDEKQGGWRAAPLCDDVGKVHQHVFREFARSIKTGCSHPMDIKNASKVQEILMGIYESARLKKRLSLPVTQMRFPLDILREDMLKEK